MQILGKVTDDLCFHYFENEPNFGFRYELFTSGFGKFCFKLRLNSLIVLLSPFPSDLIKLHV